MNKQTLNHTRVAGNDPLDTLQMSGCYITLHLTSSFQDSFGIFNQMAAETVHYSNFTGLDQNINVAFRIILAPS